MKWLRSILIALSSLRANKMRSLLTMLGIIIGVAAVITMVGIGDGAKENISRRIRSMGTNLLIVRPGIARLRRVRTGQVNTLKMGDADAIKLRVTGIMAISPEASMPQQVKFMNQNTNTAVLGATPTFLIVNNFRVRTGRFITAEDVKFQRKVAVIGDTPAKELFDGVVPLGAEIKIKGMLFTIIGVLDAKGQMGYFNPDDQVVIPLSVAQKRLFGIDYLRSINISVTDENEMGTVEEEITALLKSRHRIKPGTDADFNIRNQKDLLKTFGQITETLGLLLASIAAVSMVVGGIGIMNIMLVSVTERTREIGVRKAVGATTTDIMIQFLVESVVLSFVGGLIGVVLGVTTSKAISSFGNWNTVISIKAIAMAFLFAVLVGLFFGLYPARRAAQLNPIDALRYE